MKVLVLGAGGMAGHIVAIKLSEYGHDVMGFARHKLHFCETIVGNVMIADIAEIVKPFDAVVNCVGVLNKAVDAEPDRGIWLNSYFPHFLAKHSKRVIHISTDCVFSGLDSGKYSEDCYRSSDTMYGRSKALGELNDSRNLTIRTSIIGPELRSNGVGLFNWFMNQQGVVDGYTKAVWGGVTTLVLANAVNTALEQKAIGLIHLTNGKPISKIELLKLFNELRKEPIEIIPSVSIEEDKSLITKYENPVFNVPSYAEMVHDMRNWIVERYEFYPQYKIIGGKL